MKKFLINATGVIFLTLVSIPFIYWAICIAGDGQL
jgi:cbb3-type cytochrome oxidase subunit 3